MIHRPVWLTAGSARASSTAGDEIVVHDDESITHETPDTSHVAPPIQEPATRDEAVEGLSHRIDVIAARADRLERSVEGLAPVHVSQLPSRAELSALEERVEQSRKRGEVLTKQLDDLTESHALSVRTLDDNRTALVAMMSAKTKTDERLKDLAEELSDLRQASADTAAAIEMLREHLVRRGSADVAEVTRRLAGAYTVAIVALLAALVTLVLTLTK